jgi:hypothetical protein
MPSKAAGGVVKGCGWHGMQEVRRQPGPKGVALRDPYTSARTPGLIRHRQPGGSVGGPGIRPGACRMCVAGAAAQAASGSRCW